MDFFYEFASTYSYIAAMRIAPIAEAAGVAVRWRPFLLGPIFKAQGWDTSPFNLYPSKGRYMVRDCEREAAANGLTFRLPEPFPQNTLLAARVAVAGLEEGWGEEFSRRVYRAQFAEGRQVAIRRSSARSSMRLARTERRRWCAPDQTTSNRSCAPIPRMRSASASSARRASSRTVNCSGATTGWSRRWLGRGNRRVG